MRVAIFTETFLPKLDGIVTVICLLLDHFAARGVESVIVAPRLGDIERYANTRVITVPGVTLPIYPELKLGPPTLYHYRELRDFQPDIAHFFHPVLIGTVGMLMIQRLNVPMVTSFHLDIARMAEHYRLGFMTPFVDWATRVVFNAADYRLAPSRAVQAEMHRLGIEDVGLWGRGVDAERFHPRFRDADMRAALSGGNPDAVILLYVGRLGNEKQLDHLRPVLENVPNVCLALVGDGPSRRHLERYFEGLPVTFMGYLKGEALSQAYASADVFVFPSGLETFGLVVTEAMAAGLPVVASRVGGVGDVVEEGVTGYTFASGDIAGLIDGVRRVSASRETVTEMGAAARAFAETQTWAAKMDEVLMHYERIIDARR